MDVNILKEVKSVESKADETISKAKEEGQLKILNANEKIKKLQKSAEQKINEEKIKTHKELDNEVEQKKKELSNKEKETINRLLECSSKNKDKAMKFIIEKITRS